MSFAGLCASLWRTWSWRPLWCWLLWSTLKAGAPPSPRRTWPLLHPGDTHPAGFKNSVIPSAQLHGYSYCLCIVSPVSQISCDSVLESVIKSSHRVQPELLSWHSVKAVCPHWLFIAFYEGIVLLQLAWCL